MKLTWLYISDSSNEPLNIDIKLVKISVVKTTKNEETILCTKSCLLQQQTKCSKSDIEKANVFNIFSRVGEN